MFNLKIKVVFGIVLSVICILALTGCGTSDAEPDEDATFTWKLQSAYGPGDSTWDIQMPMFVDAIEEATDGRVQIETFIPGAICEAEQQPQSVANGVLDAAISAPGDTSQLVPAAYSEMGIPFFWTNGQDVFDTMYEFGLLDYLRTEYDKAGLYYLSYVPNGSYSLMTNFPFESAKDLEGKNIRGSGAYGEFLANLGASPVTMPGGDIYMAMKLGTIDGSIYTLTELETSKLKEVVKYVMKQPASGSSPCNLYINKDRWNELPEELQDAINLAVKDVFMKVFAKDMEVEGPAVTAATEYGVKWVDVSSENMKTFEEAGIKTADNLAAKFPASKAGFDIIKEWKNAQAQ